MPHRNPPANDSFKRSFKSLALPAVSLNEFDIRFGPSDESEFAPLTGRTVTALGLLNYAL